MDLSGFAQLPATADCNAVAPYRISIAEDKVEYMMKLVELSPVAPPCYENSLPGGSSKFGLRQDWLSAAKHRWQTTFNWEKSQARLNQYNHFMAKVDDGEHGIRSIHFVALFSRAAQPAIPLLLPHGWPGSFLEYLPVLDLLADKYTPETLPYHVIVPSLPGFIFSEPPPINRHWGIEDSSRVINSLMVKTLGFEGGYLSQGGDVGSWICRILAAKYPRCLGALLSFCPVPQPEGFSIEDLSPQEKVALQRGDQFQTNGLAYAMEQSTRPSTIGLVLSSSPLALLAWVGEKFLDWTDPASFPPDSAAGSGKKQEALRAAGLERPVSLRLMDEILSLVSLWFLTDTAPRCIFTYREFFPTDGSIPKLHTTPDYHIYAPKKMGISWFPFDVAAVPISWMATTGNLVWAQKHDAGGHFAALERPQDLLADIEQFAEAVWN